MAKRLITTLAVQRPYSARERLRAAFERHDGRTMAVAREFGVDRRTVYTLVCRLGLREVVEAIRARRHVESVARHRRAWSAYGNAIKRLRREGFPPVGKKVHDGA